MSSKKHIEEAIANIRDDREITRELLDDAIKYLAVDDARHKDIGMTLAKYVETLQRSNEQLVKLCALMSKNEGGDELTDKDFAQIFDQIQKSEEEDGDNTE
jgi:hypoxanthine-guanine phosphoribosyltransferase